MLGQKRQRSPLREFNGGELWGDALLFFMGAFYARICFCVPVGLLKSSLCVCVKYMCGGAEAEERPCPTHLAPGFF